MTPFNIAFHHATAHGIVSAVNIPDSPDPVPEETLRRLPDTEREYALTLRGYRAVQFVGGRIAMRAAMDQIGIRPLAVLSDDRGAPVLPRGISGSISHKGNLALAMVARASQGTLGVDLENYGPPRPGIASRVLSPRELAEIDDYTESCRWLSILVRFSIKEAIYKALDPYVRRYVGFHEAEVTPDLFGQAAVQLHLPPHEGPFAVDARYEWHAGRVISSVRIIKQ